MPVKSRVDEHYLRSCVALTCRRHSDTGVHDVTTDKWRDTPMVLRYSVVWHPSAVRYGGRCGTGVVSRGQTQTRRRLPPDEAPVSVPAPLYLRTHSCTSLYHNNVFAHCSRSIALPLGLFLECRLENRPTPVAQLARQGGAETSLSMHFAHL